MQHAPDLARVHVDPAGNPHPLFEQQTVPGASLQSGPGENHFPLPLEKTRSQMVQLAVPEGFGRIGRAGARGPVRPLTPEEERPAETREAGTGGCEAEPEVVVLGPPHVPVSAHTFHFMTAEHDAGMDKGGLHEEVGHDGFVGQEAVLPLFVSEHSGLHVMPGKMPERAGQQADRFMCRHEGYLPRQTVGMGNVVAVHAGHQRRPAGRQSHVQRRYEPPTAGFQHADTRIA